MLGKASTRSPRSVVLGTLNPKRIVGIVLQIGSLFPVGACSSELLMVFRV